MVKAWPDKGLKETTRRCLVLNSSSKGQRRIHLTRGRPAPSAGAKTKTLRDAGPRGMEETLLCRYSSGAQLGNTRFWTLSRQRPGSRRSIGRCISRKSERAWNPFEARTQGKTQDQTLRSAEDSAHDQIQNPTLHASVTRIPAGGTEYGVRIRTFDIKDVAALRTRPDTDLGGCVLISKHHVTAPVVESPLGDDSLAPAESGRTGHFWSIPTARLRPIWYDRFL